LKKGQIFNVFYDPKDAIKGSFGVAIITEWDEFKNLPWDEYINHVNRPANIFDGRNILEKEVFEKLGYNFYSIGR
jgi:UDPglucose 6-dehydrogenase